MGDEQDVDPEVGGAAPVAAAPSEAPKPKRKRDAKESEEPAVDPAQSEPMDFDECSEADYLIVGTYRARRVRARQYLGREVTRELFAEEGQWVVTRPNGSRFVQSDAEFRSRFARIVQGVPVG